MDIKVLTEREVGTALAKGGSIRAAAALLGKSYNSVQWWLARNGYRVERRAVLVPVRFELTNEGKQLLNESEGK